MARSYSQDLRERVIDAVAGEGMIRRAAAQRFGLSEAAAIRWGERFEETGLRTPVGAGGHRPSTLKPHRAFIEVALADKPDITLAALCRRLAAALGVKADTSMMSSFLRREGVTFKKKTLVAREQDRGDVSRRRAQWQRYQGRIDPARLVFIDETWVKTNMTRLHGWAPRGRRLQAKAPHGDWRTATFLAALRCDRLPGALPARRPHQRQALPDLYGAVSRSPPEAGRYRHPRRDELRSR
jgi:transposase